MKKPHLTPAQLRQFKRDIDTKDRIVRDMTRAMDAVLKRGVEQVYAGLVKTGKFVAPNLDDMLKVNEKFYRKVIGAAVQSCKNQSPKKRLAALPDGDLPDGKPALDRVFKNKKYWQRIMARARKLTDRQKRDYLEKLKKHFKKVLPLLDTTRLAPKEIKQKIYEAWHAAKPRAETIFRTETTKYFADAQIAYFDESTNIVGFLFDSVRDTSRTSICKSREGLIYRPGTALLSENTPPCHWNCRSHLVPLIGDAENLKLLEDPARDPTKRKVEPLPPDWRN